MAWYKQSFEPSNTSVRFVPLLVLFLLHKYYIVCSKNSTKSGTNRTDVFDGSNESLYHADEELYTQRAGDVRSKQKMLQAYGWWGGLDPHGD